MEFDIRNLYPVTECNSSLITIFSAYFAACHSHIMLTDYSSKSGSKTPVVTTDKVKFAMIRITIIIR